MITAPGSQTYEQGETITPFGIAVSDADGDTVTVTVNGLPAGLSYANGQVQGTVASSAAAQAYGVTTRADDGVNAAVEATFTITVTAVAPPNAAPLITAPGSKTYEQGETIAAFAITVSDADGDPVSVTVNGLPSGLSYAGGQVQGTVSSSAPAQSNGVTIRADDGVNAAVEATFTITVTETVVSDPPNAAPSITSPGDKTYKQGATIAAFSITV
ncbi:MAG: putative Ig domain-containing protein, partial [Acidobacteria bacterium]|nr:putative Ig domain-containing protein [Acidobacteriota bacterium]